MEGFNFDDIKKAFDDAKKKIGKVNIALIGKTGVGKSTLINAVFEENLAQTGIGRPVTQNCKEYTKDDAYFNLLDTKGFELENYTSILNQLKDIIQSRKTQDPATHIHLAWFCINSTGNRFEDAEIKFVNELGALIPVIVVLTQSINQSTVLHDRIVLEAPNVKQVVSVLAQDYEIEGLGVKKAYGLDRLVDVSFQAIPEAFRAAFAVAQKVSLQVKSKSAKSIIHGAATAAAAACAVPVPLADAAMLAPIQIGMLAGISRVMGLESAEGFFTTLVSAATGVLGATYAGRFVFTNIIKLIPGAGSAIGAAVGATTAAVITETMGNAYVATLCYLIENKIALSSENIAEAFKEFLKKKRV